MLQIKNLTITHKKDLHTLVSGFDLVLNEGDRAVVVGEEGNGKSTLLKWIYDPRLIESYAEAEGERVTQGEKLAYLPQELPEADRYLSAFEFIGAACGGGFSPKDAAKLASQLGIPEELFYSERPMLSFSGGEKVKLRTAALLLGEPDILLLDEPSNDVDLETLEWMEGVILAAGRSVLYISHDETLIERTANRVILLEQLRRKTMPRHTVANVPFKQFMAEREAAFLKQAREAGSERREEKKAQEKFRRIQQSVERAQENVSRGDPSTGRLLKKKMASVKALEKRYEREHADMTEFPEREDPILLRLDRQLTLPAGKTVLELSLPELRRGDCLLARDIELFVRGPEKVCITGRNGAGKTTLLSAIREALEGRTDLRLGVIPQDYDEALPPDETPLRYLAGSGTKDEATLVRTRLGSLRFTAQEMEHPIRELSGGQRAKLLMLSLSLGGANVLLLDEPTRNFSPLSGPQIRGILRGFPGAIISVSHDRKYVAEVCDTVYELTETGLRRVFAEG